VALMNCFLLMVPILVLNAFFADRLPPMMFSRDVFCRGIPPAIAHGENVMRVVVLAVPLLSRSALTYDDGRADAGGMTTPETAVAAHR